MNEDQLHKTQLMEIAKTCTCLHMRKATRSVTQYYDTMLKPSGLRITQFCVLVALALRGPVSVTYLADVLALDRTSITRSLKPLVGQGLLTIDEGVDRRQHLVQLTAQGSQALAVAFPYWREAQRQMVASLGQDQWAALLAGLAGANAVIQSS